MDVFLRLCVLSVLVVGYQSTGEEINCSNNPRCHCKRLKDNTLKLDCSRLQLEKCPFIYGNVSFVDLSWNRISVLDEGVLQSSVIHLDIAHNLIKTTNFISSGNFAKIETLNISFNKIKYLDESSFSHGSNLRHLDISNCDLRNVMRGTFRHLAQLLHLNISFNEFLTFKPLANITYDLQFTKIEVLDISRLHCTYGPGIVIFQEDFKYMQNTKLEILHMNNNRIAEIEKHTLKFMPTTLQKVFIKGNVLSMGQYTTETFYLSGLTSFDGSFQYKIHKPSLQTRYNFCNDWRAPRVAGFQKKIQAQSIRSFGGLSRENSFKFQFPVSMPPNLENASFIGCGVRIKIPKFYLASGNSVKRISLRGNIFHSWEGPVYNLHQLENLDLSNNFCSFISEVFLSDVPKLIDLNISNNLLGFVLHKINPFDYLHNLKSLDLSSNRINILKNDIFAKTTNLSVLIMRWNMMKTWNFTIKEMQKLRLIDLSNNNIQTIAENIRQEITRAASTRSLSINLENNQMRCECSDSFRALLKWMRDIHNAHKIFIGFQKYNCFSATGKQRYIYLSDDEAVREFELHCDNYVGMIMGVLAAIILCISFLICGLVYRFRWKLRYLFYIKKHKYLGADKRNRETQNYEFDAFLSYAEEDSLFIRTMFLDEMEIKRNFRLCLHQRDFIAGKDVAENITDAIHRSRVTIAVITPSYLKSYWCMFEFNMARMESVYARNGDDSIFLLLHKPVRTNSLPLHMLDLINNKTYIEYPEEEDEGNVVFWDGLARGMTQ